MCVCVCVCVCIPVTSRSSSPSFCDLRRLSPARQPFLFLHSVHIVATKFPTPSTIPMTPVVSDWSSSRYSDGLCHRLSSVNVCAAEIARVHLDRLRDEHENQNDGQESTNSQKLEVDDCLCARNIHRLRLTERHKRVVPLLLITVLDELHETLEDAKIEVMLLIREVRRAMRPVRKTRDATDARW